MKILLTGKNRSGKTTILQNLIAAESLKNGLTTIEVRDDSNRIGFDIIDSANRKTILARVDRPSQFQVGRYYVDVASFDAFIEPLFDYDQDQLLFIDEIGQMQLYSSRFQTLSKQYLDAANDFIGTFSAIYEHPLITSIQDREDVLVCSVTPKNRVELETALRATLNNRKTFNHLPTDQRTTVLRLARSYLAVQNFTSFKKLFNNAVHYVSEGKVTRETRASFWLQENTISIRPGHWATISIVATATFLMAVVNSLSKQENAHTFRPLKLPYE